MNTYIWKAKDNNGIIHSGEVQARNPTLAKAYLSENNLYIKRLKEKKRNTFFSKKRPSHKSIHTLYKSLFNLVTANIPLSTGLNILVKVNTDKRLEKCIKNIHECILTGDSFYNSIRRQPELRNTVTNSILENAESAGNLKLGLSQIINYLERTQSLKQKIKKALTYPCIILISTILIFAFLTIFIIPEFEKLFNTYHATLPYSTKLIFSFSSVIRENINTGILFFISTILTLRIFKKYLKTTVDKFSFKLFYLGRIRKYFINSNIFRTLSTSMSANIDIILALQLANKTTNNSVYNHAFRKIIDQLRNGNALHAALDESTLFSPIDIQIVMVAERTGGFAQAFDQIATGYEREIDDVITRFSSTAEPLIMLLLGLLVGGFVLAMYLPIFKLGSVF